MKNLLAIMLFVVAQTGYCQTVQLELSEKIKGNWVLEKNKSAEELTPFAGKMTLYFKADNTGNFNFPEKDSETFTWTITRNKITVSYAGTNEACKVFAGDFRMVIRDRKGVEKMDLIKNATTISFTR